MQKKEVGRRIASRYSGAAVGRRNASRYSGAARYARGHHRILKKTNASIGFLLEFSGAGGRTRTYDGGTPADLQSAVIATRRLQHISIIPIYYNIYGAANET